MLSAYVWHKKEKKKKKLKYIYIVYALFYHVGICYDCQWFYDFYEYLKDI